MILSAGDRFGSYEIVAPLGRGGMGEVYRARDSRLGRDVALKILHEDALRDPDRLRRFEHEARAASSLNHPNLVVVYEVGEASAPTRPDSLPYFAMELLQGESLESLMARGSLPLRRTLSIASELAEGLARAHETGLVHRDLKPSNVLVSADDHVKILDFGLAKLQMRPGAGASGAPALDEVETTPGTVLGTVGYMSPEQARSEAVTAASDQFSFGCILYELLTGRRAFSRPSAVETLSAILRDDPLPIEESSPTTPAPLRWIVERCLAKNPRDRYASTRDLARDLQSLREHSRELAGLRRTTAALRPRPPRRTLALVAGLALAAAVGALAALAAAGAFRPAAEPVMRPVTFRRGHVARALFVPRSNAILYAASWDGGPVRTFLTLPDTKALDRSLDAEPQIPMAFSEDGTQVLVVLGASRADLGLTGTLAWWPALGGRPRLLLENAGWADWAGQARRLAVARDTGQERRLELRDADGRLLRTLFHTPGAISFVRFSPDEERIAFFHTVSPVDPVGEVRILSVSGDGSRALSDRFAFCRGLDWNRRTGEIWFTAGREPTPSMTLRAVTPSGRMRLVYAFPGDFALHSIAPAGDRLLLIERQDQTRMIVRGGSEKPRDLTWFDQSFAVDVSADESSLLFFDGWTEALAGSWIRPVAGGEAVRLGEGEFGKFSPDGRWVVGLTSGRGGPPQILLHPTGAGQTRRLTASAATHWAPAFAGPDRIVYVRSEGGDSDLWTMRIDGRDTRALGAKGCDLPMANSAGDQVVCAGGAGHRSVFLVPIGGGRPRELYRTATPARLRYVRFDDRGDRVFAVTGDRHWLTLDAATGALLRDVILTGPEVADDAILYTAAISASGRVVAFSTPKLSSSLFLVSGLR